MKFAMLLALLSVAGSVPAQTEAGANPDAKVATHYFYWYRWPDEHFRAGRTNQPGHFHHFVDEKKVSYLDPKWHRAQFAAMAGCGIDFALPVYWGRDYETQKFSHLGLPPMVKALEELESEKAPAVKVGLFLDTTILRADIRGGKGKLDLRTAAGKAHFAKEIVGFFDLVPKRFWARVDGRALVVLYSSGFAGTWDRTLCAAVRAAFQKRFGGESVFLVADKSWGDIGQDRTTAWGAALYGPSLHPGVAQIGPGYDDSPVPGRRAPSRDREDGNFYRWSWRKAVASRPELVLIETWNETHEGTEICPTKELGTQYLDITRQWIARLRSGDLGPKVGLRAREPKPWNDRSWGEAAEGRDSVHVDYTKGEPERLGLREARLDATPMEIVRRLLRPRGRNAEIYFEVSDFFRFDTDDHLEVVVDAEPIGGLPIELDYDSRFPGDERGGRYRKAESRLERGRGESRRIVFDLPRARFANRQVEGTDFRLRFRGVRTAIRRVEIRVKAK